MATSNEKEYWLKVDKQLQDLLNHFSESLDEESVQSVQHYLDHSEYEMAFEGLFIELMNLKCSFSEEEFLTYIELGEKLGLNEESVFDAEFWEKFIKYCSNNGRMADES
jgi:dimeric dUTPase (all-alpha-NTP-PPase superfamily)